MGGSKGKFVESCRGYSILLWTNNDGSPHETPYTSGPTGSFEWTSHRTLEEARAAIASAPPLRKVRVEFDAYLPAEVKASEDEIDDWVRYRLHANGFLSSRNPLSDYELEALDVSCEIELVDL